jgi:hypothetical protein
MFAGSLPICLRAARKEGEKGSRGEGEEKGRRGEEGEKKGRIIRPCS